MTGKKKKTILKALAIIAIAVAAAALLFLLYRWTLTIEARNKNQELVSAMKDIVSQEGELGLFQKAGIPVEDVYLDSDGYLISSSGREGLAYSGFELQNMSVYEKCAGSVVHISTYEESSDQLSQGKSVSNGSGFVFRSDGYIVTCYHVVENGAVIDVSFADGSSSKARIVGSDKENDIAVLKVDSELEADPIAFDTSQELKVGQRVFAIGNPLGFDRTLSSGYISGLSRPLRNSSGRVVMGMIQTDVAISSGNSGCPLLDTKGNVIGLLFSAYSESGNFEAMSFAIPASTVLQVCDAIIKTGKISRGWLDIVALGLTDQIVSYAGLDVSHGLLVSQVAPNGLAAKAGLKAGTTQVKYGNSVIFLGGDIITSIEGVQILDSSDVYTALMNTKAGDKIKLTVHRNGKDFDMTVQLVERTDENKGWLLK
ncbi:MAG: trypsin-like peptidase domain-containing protein [Sphaerochaetaceae bacterium]|nr:trypsin-like peptidase domain-containing protein [Sphaerochaetaceae bacterium]